jgi:hypothetical protein
VSFGYFFSNVGEPFIKHSGNLESDARNDSNVHQWVAVVSSFFLGVLITKCVVQFEGSDFFCRLISTLLSIAYEYIANSPCMILFHSSFVHVMLLIDTVKNFSTDRYEQMARSQFDFVLNKSECIKSIFRVNFLLIFSAAFRWLRSLLYSPLVQLLWNRCRPAKWAHS